MSKIQDRDPVHRHVDKAVDDEGTSPMDPPAAYSPPATVVVPYDELHPFLRRLVDEHEALREQLDTFETALQQIQTDGLTPEAGSAVRSFFEYFEREVPRHHRSEERRLFPLLRRRLIDRGEHSTTAEQTTGIDVLEEDHLRATRQGAVACACIGLAVRLPDADSGLATLAMGVQQGRALVESLRLHIFREDNIMFGLAQKYLTTEELDAFVSDE